jgi:hypothetical protein
LPRGYKEASFLANEIALQIKEERESPNKNHIPSVPFDVIDVAITLLHLTLTSTPYYPPRLSHDL